MVYDLIHMPKQTSPESFSLLISISLSRFSLRFPNAAASAATVSFWAKLLKLSILGFRFSFTKIILSTVSGSKVVLRLDTVTKKVRSAAIGVVGTDKYSWGSLANL